MYSVWTDNIVDTDEKTRFQNSLRNSRFILDRQTEILSKMEASLDRAETNPKTYELPNWDYRQAHNNGYRQCLQLIKKLNNLDQKETNDRPTDPTTG